MAPSTHDAPGLRAVTPWRATYTPALAVTAGQRVAPGRLDDEYTGWQWMTDDSGLGGWVPAEIVQGTRTTTSFDTTELTVEPGDLLRPMDHRLGWTRCQTQDGRAGWVPDPCLTPDQPLPPSSG